MQRGQPRGLSRSTGSGRLVRVCSTRVIALRHLHVEPQQTFEVHRRSAMPVRGVDGDGLGRRSAIFEDATTAAQSAWGCPSPTPNVSDIVSDFGIGFALCGARDSDCAWECLAPELNLAVQVEALDVGGNEQTMEWPMLKRLRPQSVPPSCESITGSRSSADVFERAVMAAQSAVRAVKDFELERQWIFLLLWRLKPHQQPPSRV